MLQYFTHKHYTRIYWRQPLSGDNRTAERRTGEDQHLLRHEATNVMSVFWRGTLWYFLTWLAGTSQSSIGNIPSKGSFSIAILVYQRVNKALNLIFNLKVLPKKSQESIAFSAFSFIWARRRTKKTSKKVLPILFSVLFWPMFFKAFIFYHPKMFGSPLKGRAKKIGETLRNTVSLRAGTLRCLEGPGKGDEGPWKLGNPSVSGSTWWLMVVSN